MIAEENFNALFLLLRLLIEMKASLAFQREKKSRICVCVCVISSFCITLLNDVKLESGDE